MQINCLLVLLLLQFTLDTHGKVQNKKFRQDYTYVEETQSFYKFFAISKTWHEGLTACAREGATLFYAKDLYEFNAVAKIWSEPIFSIFIGVSSFFSKDVFTSFDNIPLKDLYNNFLQVIPNNLNGDEICIEMTKYGQMQYTSCTNKLPFICKKKLESLEWHEDCQTPYNGYVINKNLGRCYKFFLTPMNWTEAFEMCFAEESYLAIINSKEEANFLKKLTEDAPKKKVKGEYFAGVVMLGFVNRFNQGWLSIKGATLEDSGYSQWGYAQPEVEDKYLCGSMFYNGELTYGDCSQRSFFICEKNRVGVV